MIGKQYLVDLSRSGAALIPTIDHLELPFGLRLSGPSPDAE